MRRICQGAAYVECIGETRVAISLREISDFGEVEHEKEDVGDIDLPDTLQKPRRADDKPTFEHHPCEDKGDSVAGNEDEEIRRIAEAVVPRCHPVHDVVGDMVQEDSPICHASE